MKYLSKYLYTYVLIYLDYRRFLPLLHRYWHKQGLGTASKLLVSAVSAAAVFSHFFARLHGKVFNNNFLDFLIIFLVYFVLEVSSAG